MPSVGSSRVKTSGRGEIEYSQDSATSNGATTAAVSTPVDEPILSVVGENVGGGLGLFNGVNGSDHVVMEFKTLKAGAGIAIVNDGLSLTIRATGNATGNGGTIIGDGFDIQLGDIANKGDGSWAPGAVDLTDSTPMSEAIDEINELLGLLIPAAPPAFPNGTLTIINTAGNSPRLAAGFTSHVTGQGTPVAGDAVARITTTGVSTNTLNDVGPANRGKIQLLLNDGFVGERTLTENSDNGNYGGLIISDEKDFPVDKPGFWKSLDVAGTAVPVAQGLNKVRINHTNAGTTANTLFVRDDMTASPSIPTGSVALQTLGTVAYSSGIPHFGQGGVLTVGGSITNLAGQTYYGGNDPLTITGTNTVTTAQAFSYTSLGITTPIPAQTTSATATTGVAVSIDGTTHSSGVIQAVAKNVNGQTAPTTLSQSIILVKRGVAASNRLDELNVPVINLGTVPNANYATRTLIAANADRPAGATANWDATAALASYEAAVWAGALGHCQVDFTSGYLPQGPNYSQGRSGAQYATFTFNRASVSNFRINVVGTYAGVWVKLPGVSDNSAISPNATNGWWDATKAYAGAGVPGNSSDSLAGCVVGTPMGGTSGAYQITFGPQSSTNATSNQIIVRIRLNAGQVITSLNFSN
jgi:hypothetical protein